MKLQFTFYTLILCAVSSTAQIILGGGAKIKIDGGTVANPIFVVLAPPATNPIIVSGVTDGIIMEDEFNRLQYNLATATTSISVPYMTTALEQIPLSVVTNTAGVGTGNIRFSAKVPAVRATGFDNATYMPSDVTNMGALPATANNSAKTLDRFWIIDANAYTTKPAVTLDFTYLDAELAANGGNAINEAGLGAQRFNSTINDWDFYYYAPAGTINTATNKLSNINVPAADFFKSWAMNDKSSPLPIELLNFDATCVNNDIVLNWCTATEKNNDYFTIEQSINGTDFNEIGKVYGNGTTGIKHCYSFISTSIADINYFKLTQTDFNGTKESFNIIAINSCQNTNGNILIANNGTKTVGVILNSLTDQSLELQVHNALGQLIDTRNLEVQKGSNNIFVDLNHVSVGVYYVSVLNGSEKLISKKVLINDLDK